MKKLFAILSILICMTLLFACSPDDGGGSNNDIQGGSGGDTSNDAELLSYTVICPEGYAGEGMSQIFYAMGGFSNVSVDMANDTKAPSEREILFGRTNREISAVAYEKLERVNKEKDSELAYIIYSDGKNVAIAYEEDKFETQAGEMSAAEGFKKAYNDDIFAPKPGVAFSGTVDYVEYQRAIDIEGREQTYNSIRNLVISYTGDAVLAEDVVDALRKYYSLTTPNIASWLANLYDPDIDAATRGENDPQKGGFYYSNSGRNTLGFLPDLESTAQAMMIIHYSGMVDHLGGQSGMPDWFKSQIGNFAKSLQDPNGFFYHPQWGKTLTDRNQERRARDAGHGLSMVKFGGLKPTYNLYSTQGDGLLIDGTRVDAQGNVIPTSKVALTERLQRSNATAVSRVVATAAYVSPELLTKDAFLTWLETGTGFGNIRQNSYGWGSMVGSRDQEYLQRDKQLEAEGANWRVMDVLIDYLNDNQNPVNGTWHWGDESDERYYYNCVNGLLKIGGTYTSAGVPMPHALEACQTAISAIYSETKPIHICDVYNPWFAVGNVFDNLTKCSPSPAVGKASVNEIRVALLADAPRAITNTLEKRALFKKEDGSFSYLPDMTSCTSTGMTVALKNVNEGDVNATVIAAVDIRDRMCKVLGIPTVDILGKADYFNFINILEELGPVIKDEDAAVLNTVDFEDYSEYTLPEDDSVRTSSIASGGDSRVVSDPRGSSKGKVFKYESIPGKGDTLRFPTNSVSYGVDCSVFEAEMCFAESSLGYTVQMFMGSQYMLGVRFDSERAHFFDSSSSGGNRMDNDFESSVAIGEWFKLRIEFYYGEHGSVRIKVYLNDALIAVSDNYYDYYGYKINDGVGTPTKDYSNFDIFCMTGSHVVMYIDNARAGKIRNTYKITTNNTPLAVNVDSPAYDEKLYDFESENLGKDYPDDFKVEEGADTVEVVGGDSGNRLYIKGAGVEDNYLKVDIPATLRSNNAAVVMLEANIDFLSAEAGATLELGFRQRGSDFLEYGVTGYALKIESIGGKDYVLIYECVSGTLGAPIKGIQVPVEQSFKLRIEYYVAEKATVIYIDGAMLGFSTAVTANIGRYNVGELVIKNKTTKKFEVCIDNILFEKRSGSFSMATKPEFDRVTHTFDSEDESITLSGGAEIVDGHAKLQSAGSAVKIPLNKRSEVVSASVFEMLANISGEGGSGSLELCDDAGNIILAYELSVRDGKVSIYEATAAKVYSVPVAVFDADADTKLTVEYHLSKDVVQISLNGVCLAESSIQYSSEAEGTVASSLVIRSSGARILVDEIFVEAYNKFYEAKMPGGDNVEDEAKDITFEGSTTGNLPLRITTSLGSGGASVRIDEFIGYTETSKAIILGTNPGGADTLSIKACESYSESDCFVFEADICINTGVYMFFNAGGKTIYRINLNADAAKKKLRIDDNPGFPPYGTMKNPESSIKLGKWGRIRIELYNKDDGTVAARVAVNGYHLVDGNEPSWSGNVNAITNVNMTTSSGGKGYFALDNLYFGPGVSTIDPTVKPPVIDKSGPETFEDYDVGDFDSDVMYNDGKAAISVKEEEGNKYYEVAKPIKTEDYLYVTKKPTSPEGANCTVFETKLRINDEKSTVFSVNIIYGRWNGMQKLTLGCDEGSDVIWISDWRDGAKTSLNVTDTGARVGEWFTLRIENYLNGDGETIARVYVNGICIGESTNAGVLGSQSSLHHLDSLVIKANSNIIGSVDFDDLYFGQGVMLPFTPPAPEEQKKPVEDFEDGKYTIAIDGGPVRTPGALVTESGNSFYNKPTDTSDYLYFENSGFAPSDSDCTAFEAKLRINHLGTYDSSFKLFFGRYNGLDKFTFITKGKDIMVSDGRSGTAETFSGDTGANVGEWFAIRVEVYEKENGESLAKLYVNGKLIGESANVGVLGAAGSNANLDKVALLLNNNIRGTGAEGDVYGSVDIDDVYLGRDKMMVIEKKEEKAEILSTPTGAGGIVVIMHDDGNTPASAQLIDTLFQKYGLKGDVALIASRLYENLDIGGNPNMEYVNAWRALFDSGRWNLTNHSLTHTFWGTSTVDSLTVDEEKLYDEVVTSREILRNLFPDRRVLTYAIPGISAVSNIHGKTATYQRALELISEYYIGVRDYEGYATDFDYVDFDLVDAEVIGGTWTERTVNEAAEGKVAVIFTHEVNDSGLAVHDTVFKQVADYVAEGKVWNAFFEEMVLYLSERRAASLEVIEGSDSITVKLTDTLDDEIYDMPLTVRVALPESWEAVKVTEGDSVSYALAKMVDGRWVADISVKPDGADAILTAISADDIEVPDTPDTPDTPVTPIVPPPSEGKPGNGYDDGGWL